MASVAQVCVCWSTSSVGNTTPSKRLLLRRVNRGKKREDIEETGKRMGTMTRMWEAIHQEASRIPLFTSYTRHLLHTSCAPTAQHNHLNPRAQKKQTRCRVLTDNRSDEKRESGVGYARDLYSSVQMRFDCVLRPWSSLSQSQYPLGSSRKGGPGPGPGPGPSRAAMEMVVTPHP